MPIENLANFLGKRGHRSHGIDLVVLEYTSHIIRRVKMNLTPPCAVRLYEIPVENLFESRQLLLTKIFIIQRNMDVHIGLCIHHCGTVAAESQKVTCLVSETTMMTKLQSCMFIYLYLSFHMKKDLQYSSTHYMCGLSVVLSSYPHGREEISFRTR